MAFKDKLTTALTSGALKVSEAKAQPNLKTTEKFSTKVTSDKGLSQALMDGKVFSKKEQINENAKKVGLDKKKRMR